jgi:predicted RNA methylase
MNELQVNISKMEINGNRLELPPNEIFKNYAMVKKTLIKAGGKYVKNGFVFSDGIESIKARLTGGEIIDDKKKFQFFATPKPIANILTELAEIDSGDYVLEPSAGQGAIVECIPRVSTLQIVEIMPENCKILVDKGYKVFNKDFLTLTNDDFGGTFNKVVANPPFTNNQDIDHIKHMQSLMAESGILVSISSNSWRTGTQKKQVAFREWLDTFDYNIYELPSGTFKESGTMVATNILVIYT